MPLRNPFTRRTGGLAVDENTRPEPNGHHPGFERVNTVGSKASSALSVRSVRNQDNGEYKMSVVNDSGVYLPPSPTEERAQWLPKHISSRASTDTKSSVGDIEPFSITRESFDSYRRSFDISARSPIVTSDVPARQSLDSARFRRLPRGAVDRKMELEPPTAEEDNFEDVGLDDHRQPHQRRRGFLSRFSEPQEKDAGSQVSVSRILTGRKRAPSGGQGAELGNMEQPKTMPASEGAY